MQLSLNDTNAGQKEEPERAGHASCVEQQCSCGSIAVCVCKASFSGNAQEEDEQEPEEEEDEEEDEEDDEEGTEEDANSAETDA